jgi:hypothetical protein
MMALKAAAGCEDMQYSVRHCYKITIIAGNKT